MANHISATKKNYLKKCERKFRNMLEQDFKNNLIERDTYESFKIEIMSSNLDFIYGLYIAYLITRKEC